MPAASLRDKRKKDILMKLLYITDVFCPWCYGFIPVMQKLQKRHALPVRVLGGNLVETPRRISEMLQEHPTILAFFERLEHVTGQATERFRQLLEHAGREGAPDWLMHSPAMNLPLAALRSLAPGDELAQMEAFEEGFYAETQDVMNPSFWDLMADRWNVSRAAFHAALEDQNIRARAEQDAAEAEQIMGEFCLYPTLYLELEGERKLLARGYVSYEEVEATFAAALRDMPETFAQGAACDADGCCILPAARPRS